MPKNYPHIAFRAEPQDAENLRAIADEIRRTTGKAFVSPTVALRAALKAAAAGKRVAEVVAPPR